MKLVYLTNVFPYIAKSLNFNLELKKAGYQILYTPDAHIFHLEGAGTKKNKKFRRQMIAQSEYLYFTLCYKEIPKILLMLLCAIPQLYRLVTSSFYTLK